MTASATCMTIRWPYVRFSSFGGCAEEFPPPRAYAGRDPEEIFARPYAFLNEQPEAIHRFLSGFARPSADRGWWVAFVPRSAGHGPIEVIAYGPDGDRLGTPFTLRRP